MPRNLLAAISVCALLALLLSYIPTVSYHQNTAVPTFQPAQPLLLSKQNVVDLFTFVQTHYNIKRVKWEDQSIYVDLAVNGTEKLELPLIYRDFYSLAYQSLQTTRNVQHVYFRLLEEQANQDADQPPKMLVAIQADRPAKKETLPALQEIHDLPEFVENHFFVRQDPFFQERVSP